MKHILFSLLAVIPLAEFAQPANPDEARPTVVSTSNPNILFIAVDDMNDWVGCLNGHPDAITPNIDRLAARGTLFTNGHTAAPVCNPSRAAFLSGRGPWTTGVYHNGDNWDQSPALRESVLLPRHFRDHGYRVMMGGKLYHGGPKMTKDIAHEDAGRMGAQSFTVIADDFPYPFKDLSGVHNFAVHWGGLEDEEAAQLSDPKIAAWASKRLAQTYDDPFFLMVGFHRPHTPLTSPKEFWDQFDREKLTLPPLNPNDLDDMPWMGKQVAIAGFQGMEGGHYKQITERGHHRDVLKGYLAACAFVDAQIGKVLDALDASPHRDNTIVVLFSDHGWGVGERYHFKKWGLWDDTTRVPFIIHAPYLTAPGSQTDAGVTLLDLYPTLVDLSGIDSPRHPLDGRSLRSLLKNPEARWTRPALTTYGPNNHALRTSRWRYIRWADGSEELYDHENDPNEWRNVASDASNDAIKTRLAKYFPKNNRPAIASDHASPITLTTEDGPLKFSAVQPSFVGQPITIRATIGPNLSDGVVLQHGGQYCGYALYVQNGKPAFAIMDVPRPLKWNTLIPKRAILISEHTLTPGKKYHLEARIQKNGTTTLTVDGSEVARGQAQTLSIHPAGVMQLGAVPDKHIPVGNYEPPFPFDGDIDSVTVKFGKGSQ
ncbi:MAG: sulfatase-like hydrolase/transferase [Opitutaceae bacterium]|nr:sulfatase-like hydrolase/transferase [Opitutaceae bacterium]